MDFPWAVNKLKLKIAEQKLKQSQNETGKELNEENIKEQYIKLGGLVREIKKVKNVNKTADKAIEKQED